MILTALAKYYHRTVHQEDGPPAFGYAVQAIVAAIDLRPDGTIASLSDMRLQTKVGKVLKPRPQRLMVPLPPTRPGTGVAAAFLCDNAAYLFGYGEEGKKAGARLKKKFAASTALHETILNSLDHPLARAIRAHFSNWTADRAAALFNDQPEEYLRGWLVFRDIVTGTLAHNIPEIRARWETRAGDQEGVSGQCLVSGDTDMPIARLHPPIKIVQGAQSSGAALVSFNKDSFTSYGKEQNFNAPVSERAAFAYVTALNHLGRPASRQKLQIGDMTVLIWAERESPLEDKLAVLLGGYVAETGKQAAETEDGEASPETADKAKPEDAPDSAQVVRDQLVRIAAGNWAKAPEFGDQKVKFFILGLAPNAGRIQVRFFMVNELGILLERLQTHCRDILFEKPEIGMRIPTLWTIARDILPRDADGKVRNDDRNRDRINKLRSDLLRTVLAGHGYPHTLLPVLLDRLRSDRRLTSTRLGMIKGCINRQRRNDGHTDREIPMGLDDTNTETGYVLGRLFAMLERLQEISRSKQEREKEENKEKKIKGEAEEDKKRRGTIRDRFMSGASTNPQSIFPYLMDLQSAHEKKALRDNFRSARWIGRQIGEVIDMLDPKIRFPAELDIDQQGLFFIAYHQQQQAWRKDKAAPLVDETEENQEGTEA